MSRQGTIRRYTLIIEKINFGQYPSFSEIQDYLDAFGFSVSKRTIERDFEAIRNEFGMAIFKSVETEKFSEKLKAFTDKEEKKKYMEETVLPAITKSLEKVVDEGKDKSGAKWSDLIKDGKLPGTKPK